MKRLVCMLLVTVTFQCLHAQVEPIEVADNTLKVAAFADEVFYYAFAEGDELIFDFTEEKGKELKEIEITTISGSSVFMDFKTKRIDHKKIKISRTGIYKFRFANSGIGGKICKFSLHRIPASDASKNFDPTVYWRTVHDTTRSMVPERYLVSREYKTEELISPTNFYINSGSNATLKDGKSRIAIPILLPKNTVEWYYVFSATRGDRANEAAKQSSNLMGQVTKLLGAGLGVGIAVSLLTSPPGGDPCDIYLLDQANSQLFLAKSEYRHYPEGGREHITNGVVKIKKSLMLNNFIGIKNPDAWTGINVSFEAVAIVLEEKWDTRQVEKMNVTAREEAYIKAD